MIVGLVSLLAFAAPPEPAGAATTPPKEPKMSYLDNGQIRLGANLELGGAITFLAKSGSKQNLVNSYDMGRQIQMSHYSGPNPFEPNGKKPHKVWAGLGWNPIQSGDCYGNHSRVLESKNDGKTLYVRCIPLQWPLENEPGECTYECWVTLAGNTVRVRSRINNHRSDKTQYAGCGQELPALYTNGPWHRLMTYTGDQPFTGGSLTQMPHAFPWNAWQATENWAALVDDGGFGVGVWAPGVGTFAGGFAGKPGSGGPTDYNTGYIAPVGEEILDHNIAFEYRYMLVVGSLDEIRKEVYAQRREKNPPSYRFSKGREHWHYVGATDTGWPIRGELNVLLDSENPQLIGPTEFWKAEDAPKLTIEAAYHTAATEARVFWKRHDAPTFAPERSLAFKILPDGQFHRYTVDLSASPEYRGTLAGLRIDPVVRGAKGDTVRVRSISLGR